MKNKKNRKSLVLVLALALSILLFNPFVLGVGFFGSTTSGSFSEVNTNYFSNSVASYSSFGFGSLMSGIQNRPQDTEGFFDMEVFIPPLGCQPTIVTSDLLEEQDVPVFCTVVPLRINPSIDITRIESLSIGQAKSSPYISGVGWHPARAAISSGSRYINNPTTGNLGYAVVVLKRQANENTMPDNVSTTLTATIQYGANYAFGIGENEFYLPVISDSDFASTYHDYSFFNGVGYLRAEDIDSTGATISIYTSNNQKVYSTRIQTGKTSSDIYLPTGTGGQGMRITLKDLATPQTKAKIKVNGKSYEVYQGGQFADNNCRVSSLVAYGAGTGFVTFTCGSEKFTLTKSFEKVKLEVPSDPSNSNGEYSIGDQIPNQIGKSIYPVYVGSSTVNAASGLQQTYLIIAATDESLTRDQVNNLMIEVSNRVQSNSKIDKTSSIYGTTLYLLGQNDKDPTTIKAKDTKATGFNVRYKGQVNENSPITSTNSGSSTNSTAASNTYSSDYYSKAKTAYEYVKSTYPSELNNVIGEPWNPTGQAFGADALWAEYNLATLLKQKQDAVGFLSRIMNDYPTSTNKLANGETAESLLKSATGTLSNSGSEAYSQKQDLSFELVGINAPTEDEASVKIDYFNGNTALTKVFKKGDVMTFDEATNTKVTLVDFTDTQATITYSCNNKAKGARTTSITSSPKTVNENQVQALDNCDGRIQITKINRKQVAHVTLTPMVNGRSRTVNFTFSIGIEKRPDFLKPTPEEAADKIKDLNEKIDDLNNITDTLGKVVEGGKIACLATSTFINLKNLYQDRNGGATARKQVMDNWKTTCATYISTQGNPYFEKTIDDCIAGEYSKIEKEIASTQKIDGDWNTADSEARKTAKDSKGFVNETKAKEILITKLQSELVSSVSVIDTSGNVKDANFVKDSLNKNNAQYLSYDELAKLNYDLRMASDNTLDSKSQTAFQKAAYSDIKLVQDRANLDKDSQKIASQFGGFLAQSVRPNQNQQVYTYSGKKWDSTSAEVINNFQLDEVKIPDGSKVAIVSKYLFVLQGDKNTLGITNAYKLVENGNKWKVVNFAEKDNPSEANIESRYSFQQYDATSYKNVCKNCNYMKVFTTEPYKGLPALLPFDDQNGWYIQVKQTITLPSVSGVLSGNTQKSYQSSGQLNSFYICNVGQDGLMEGTGIDNDCRGFNMNTGEMLDSFAGLTSAQTRTLVQQAISAIRSAQTQLTKNPQKINIKGVSKPLTVIGYQGSDSEGKCTDFMSPSDCQWIFNVCDPVVCPSSRCDLGGQYKVDNVIQSGIVGSTLLCFPNFIGFHPDTGVVVPFCVTGINAGLQAWTSILKDYRKCLNDSLTDNRTTGICDMMWSVYGCEFFWRQIGPFTEALMKNAFLSIFGKGEKGGGEYMFTQDAWNNAVKSAQYMQTTYGANSNLQWGISSLADAAVSDVCKLSASATYPSGFDAMLTPESPVQFSAFFEEVPYTDATVPPTSHYKVFYQIFAGNDQGHYYTVYLKSNKNGFTYSGNSQGYVASGYVPAGGSKSDTPDYLDVSGFQELCVRIDGQEKCGFKSVSTSFALNYAKDKAVQAQATSGATSASECVSGTNSLGAFLTPNLQQGAQEFVNPELYNQGVIRICSNRNPGENVEPTRWQKVGYCDTQEMGCWVDTNSIKNAIQGKGILNQTLSQINSMSAQDLVDNFGYYGSDIGGQEIKKLINVYYQFLVENMKTGTISDTETYSGNIVDADNVAYSGKTLKNMEEDFKKLENRLIMTNQKAEVSFLKAFTYGQVAEFSNVYASPSSNQDQTKTTTTTTPAKSGTTKYKFETSSSWAGRIYIFNGASRTNFFKFSETTEKRYQNKIYFCTTNTIAGCTSEKLVFNIVNNKLVELNPPYDTSKLSESDKKVYNDLIGADMSGSTSNGNIDTSTSAKLATAATTATYYPENSEIIIDFGDGNNALVLTKKGSLLVYSNNDKVYVVGSVNNQGDITITSSGINQLNGILTTTEKEKIMELFKDSNLDDFTIE